MGGPMSIFPKVDPDQTRSGHQNERNLMQSIRRRWEEKMVDLAMMRAEMDFHQHMAAALDAARQMTKWRDSLTAERVEGVREAIGALTEAADRMEQYRLERADASLPR
jgi:hypothetical protein